MRLGFGAGATSCAAIAAVSTGHVPVLVPQHNKLASKLAILDSNRATSALKVASTAAAFTVMLRSSASCDRKSTITPALSFTVARSDAICAAIAAGLYSRGADRSSPVRERAHR